MENIKLTEEQQQKLSTEDVTFRVPTVLLDQLRKESKNKQVSLNTLVNQIFKKHTQFHSFATQARLYYITTSFGRRLVNTLADEDLIKIAKETAKKGSLFRMFKIVDRIEKYIGSRGTLCKVARNPMN